MPNLYGSNHDGITAYSSTSAASMQISGSTSWAIGQILKLSTKATQYHYYLSTGALNLSEINAFFDQANNEIGWNSTGATYRTGAHPELLTDYCVVIHGQDGDAFKVTVCPLYESGTEETIATGQSATTKTGKTFQFMRRGDANVDRYSKGIHSHPMRFSAYPSLAQVEAFASSLDAATEFSGILDLSWPYDDNTTTTPVDAIEGAVITQNNMPTDGSQWILIAGASAPIVAIDSLSQGSALDQTALVQHSVLALDSISNTQSLTEVNLVQHSIAAIDSLTQATSIGEPTILQGSAIAIAGLSQSVELSAVILTQHHNVVIDDLAAGMTLDQVTITEHSVVELDALTSQQSIGGVTLVSGDAISIASLANSQTVGQPLITQGYLLAIDSVSMQQMLTEITPIQHHFVTIQDLAQAQLLEEITVDIASGVSVTINSLAMEQAVEDLTLAVTNVVAISDLTHQQLIQAINFGGVVVGYFNGAPSIFYAYNGKVKVQSIYTGEVKIS